VSVNQTIESALKPICSNVWPIVCPDDNHPAEYIVYNPEYEAPATYADDQDQNWIHYMQVHFFTKKNYIKKRKEIRRALRQADFLVTEIDTDYEKDSGYYHLTFSCQIEESEE